MDNGMTTPTGLRGLLVDAAVGLIEPGELDESPEYVRGMVELIVRAMEAAGDREPESHVRVAEIMEQLRGRTSAR
jgi:hypothetical protein